jgi:hypothetical protein
VDPVGGFFTLVDKRVDQLEHVHHLEKRGREGWQPWCRFGEASVGEVRRA